MTERKTLRLLDVVMHYDCNLACTYCTITPAMRERALLPKRIAFALSEARKHGVTEVQFTGGEPTIRPDLLPLIRRASSLGYERIYLQTNGLLLSDKNLERLEKAGVTDLIVSIHTHNKTAYDVMVQRAGAFVEMEAGLRRAAKRFAVTADLIMTRQTMLKLSEAVEFLADRNVLHARLWLVSLTDGNASNPGSLPSFSELMPYVERAFERATARGLDLVSLHLPKCVLGKNADRAIDPAEGGVRLLTPDDERDLVDAKLTPGTYVNACRECVHRKTGCRGLRHDYLEIHGDDGITPLRNSRR